MAGVAAASNAEEKKVKKALFAVPTARSVKASTDAAETLKNAKTKSKPQRRQNDTGISSKYLKTSCCSAVSSFFENWLPRFRNVGKDAEVSSLRVKVKLRVEVSEG